MAWSKSTSSTVLSLLLRRQHSCPFSSRPLLASETSTAGGGNSESSTTNVLLIHGLLGSGRNWRSVARALAAGAAARAAELVNASSPSSSSSSSSSPLPPPPPPRVSVTAVDLRCHGGTNATMRELFGPPHGISAAAADVNAFATAAFGKKNENDTEDDGFSSSSSSSPPSSSSSCQPQTPPAAPDVLIGHSLGGKVALEAARQALVSAAPLPEQLWVLDSPLSARRHDSAGPATRRARAAAASASASASAAAAKGVLRGAPRAPGATAGVLAAVRSVPPSALGSRRDAERWLLENSEGRVTPSVAAWLCSQLVAKGEGGGGSGSTGSGNNGRGDDAPPPLLSFAFDPEGAAELFESYQTLDAWPLLKCPPVGLGINVVVGGRSDRWSAAERRRLAEAERGSAASAAPTAAAPAETSSSSSSSLLFPPPPRHLRRGSLKVHVLPQAGHWVHVDDQEGLLRLLVPAVAEVAAGKALRAAAAVGSERE